MAQFELIAARSGDRIGVLRAFSRSEAQAATDPLTGLLNRRSFEEEVGALALSGTRFAIAYGDLDQFKSIAKGHEVDEQRDFSEDAALFEVDDVNEGTQSTKTFKIAQPGRYQLICAVEGHFSAGMHATLVVV